MAIEVQKNERASRYEVLADGRIVGLADYVEEGGTVMMPHTEVDGSMRGQGIAAKLVAFALDDVRASGRTVVPQCWYVAQFIDEHPEYKDLLAA